MTQNKAFCERITDKPDLILIFILPNSRILVMTNQYVLCVFETLQYIFSVNTRYQAIVDIDDQQIQNDFSKLTQTKNIVE